MKIFLAKTAGFCMGVQRADNMVLSLLDEVGGNIYTFGPLIHNPQATELLKARGVRIAENLDEPLPEGGIMVIRAHGIPPQTREEIKRKHLIIKDATCPKVLKVQSIIKKHVNNGYCAIIIGDKGHPEVKGLQGFAGTEGFVINSMKELEELPDLEKVCVVAQTTQNKEKFLAISERIKEKAREYSIYNTICESTSKRQAEIKELAREVDLLVIIGGRNSGNTQRLVEIGRSTGIPTMHIESEEELKAEDLAGRKTIGVSAGASTPAWVIEKVILRLRQLGGTGHEND